jgi:amidophosphoribosyltransferase
VEAAQDSLNQRKLILENRDNLTEDSLQEVLSVKIRTEK